MKIQSVRENFSKNNRLRKKVDFESLHIDSKSKSFGSVKIYYKKSLSPNGSRLGISLSSKYFNSVERNSLKRVIREFFRKNIVLFVQIDLVVAVRYSKIDTKCSWKTFLSKVRSDLKKIVNTLN